MLEVEFDELLVDESRVEKRAFWISWISWKHVCFEAWPDDQGGRGWKFGRIAGVVPVPM